MGKRVSHSLLCLITLFIISSATVLAEVSVGVKTGDWIEYNITYIGSPPDEYPEWIKIEITNIQGSSITANLTVQRLDGTKATNTGTFDLEIGVPDLLLIPAGLDIGDKFYHAGLGNITILGEEEYTYAGAKRTVVYSIVDQILLHWDRTTGILLQSDQSTDDFTQTMMPDKTNMWQAQIFGLEPIIFYALMIVVIIIVALVAFFLLRRSELFKEKAEI